MSTKGTKKFKNSTGVWQWGLAWNQASIDVISEMGMVFIWNFRVSKKYNIVYISRFSPSEIRYKRQHNIYNMKSPTTKKINDFWLNEYTPEN